MQIVSRRHENVVSGDAASSKLAAIFLQTMKGLKFASVISQPL
jgi:hypothetical protein